MRFDETMLRHAYYQTLLPIYQTNTNGNGRADMMRMAQVVSSCAPDVIAVPVQEDGKRSFKLGVIAAANNIALKNAHDALADTSATLGVARLIKQRASALWDTLIANARKAGPLNLLQTEPVLLLSEHFGKPCNSIVTAIEKNADNRNEWALFDLQFDPALYLDAGDDDLLAAIDGTPKAIRRVSINAQPGLLPIDFTPHDLQGGRLSLQTYQARAKAIRERPAFRRRISRALTERYKDQAKSLHIEQQIYAGFPSSDDCVHMHAFHGHGWNDRVDIIGNLKDKRYREFGRCIMATERPDLLTAEQRLQWNSWCRDRLRPSEDVPWLSAYSALEELAKLANDATPVQHDQFLEMQRFFEGLGR